MNPTTVSNIATMSGGTLISGLGETEVRRVVIDSRRVGDGDLFVALKGDNFDGHDFLAEVVSSGAAAVLVDREVSCSTPVIRVENSLIGLQTLAKNYRAKMRCHIVAITGSNGKTSTKDLCAAVFSSKFSVSKTQGNLNNHIGLPLSILAIEDAHHVAILEIGMNHAGEIAPLAKIAAPNAAVITNIGTAHLEHLKTRDAIALEKGLLAESVASTGLVILNSNDRFAAPIAARCHAKVMTAGIEAGDVAASLLVANSLGTQFLVNYKKEAITAFLPIAGKHMVGNAMLAVAAGIGHGISLQNCVDALKTSTLTEGRLEVKMIADIRFIDDTYNANPDSMIAALATLGNIPVSGKRVAVLGAMGELGDFSEEGHRQVGRASEPVDLLVTVGQTADWIADEAEKCGTHVMRTADTAQAAAVLLSLLKAGDCVLVKGSRAARMEKVINEITISLEPGPVPS